MTKGSKTKTVSWVIKPSDSVWWVIMRYTGISNRINGNIKPRYFFITDCFNFSENIIKLLINDNLIILINN
ncbi:MAG: hypothetical protein ACJAWO_000480 [Halieaceae bacterium]|jgi:hypothetical protein